MKKITILVVTLIAIGLGAYFVSGFGKYSTTPVSTSVATQGKANAVVISITPTSTPTPKSSVLTLAQVSQHNTPSDCYLIIKGAVYDVSSYINKHPGGSNNIISSCGSEVTGIFASIHSNAAWNLLKNYQVATLK
ncbi:cytochrome b5 domain-containing protein [Candidatus Woesebacteria bacterium]|nr:cytochrome b5 domain-containing protein [Candidatus Woesebacteria bacterium]